MAQQPDQRARRRPQQREDHEPDVNGRAFDTEGGEERLVLQHDREREERERREAEQEAAKREAEREEQERREAERQAAVELAAAEEQRQKMEKEG